MPEIGLKLWYVCKEVELRWQKSGYYDENTFTRKKSGEDCAQLGKLHYSRRKGGRLSSCYVVELASAYGRLSPTRMYKECQSSTCRAEC